MSKYKDLKNRCLKANLRLNLNQLSIMTFGNVSIIDRDNEVIAIKPSGVKYDLMKENDIVVLDFNGNIIEGELNPSSDTKTHIYLYKKWQNIKSICHTHSTYAVAWSQSLKSVPILGTTHADHLTEEIPCTPPMSDSLILGDYEYNTGVQIVNYFEKNNLNHNNIMMVLVGSHGPFTWGGSENESVNNSIILEELCKMATLTLTINPNIKKLKKSLIKKHYERKHGNNAYYGQKNP